MRGFLLVLFLALLLILALWLFRFQGKSQLEQDMAARDRALVRLTEVNLNTLEQAITMFIGQEGRVPASLEELRQTRLLTADTVDAWGRGIRYEPIDDSKFRLRSAGADGVFDTADDIVRTR